jgi:hypothetical protein
MRTAILAAVALGLAGFIASANAAPADQPQQARAQTQNQTAQNTCPAGYYWSSQLHYDTHGAVWPAGCIENGR